MAGAAAWVMLATHRGLPVSTTHALLGGLVGAAAVSGGRTALQLDAITTKAIAPLLAGPLLAIVLTSLFILVLKSRDKLATVEHANDSPQNLNNRASASLHWLTSGVTSFARGLNDTPKIAAFLILALSLTPDMSPGNTYYNAIWPILLVTAVMGKGCLWGGFKVLNSMAYQITTLSHSNGIIANAGTALLVLAASPLGLPVSTTHVSTGALMGIRWPDKRQPQQQDALRMILFGWVITLPVAAIIAAASMALTSYI